MGYPRSSRRVQRPGGRVAARCAVALLLVTLLLVTAVRRPVSANGGQVRVADYPVGPYVVTVFTSPVPLQTGVVDVSVLVQRRDDKRVVEDAEIVLTVEPAGGGTARQYPVTRDQATSDLYYAAEFPIDQPGDYRMRIDVRAPEGAGVVTFDVTVERAGDALWRSWWLWGAIALVAIPLVWWLFGGAGDTSRPSAAGRTATGRRR